MMLLFSFAVSADVRGLEWLQSMPVSVNAKVQGTSYEIKMKLDRRSHIRIMKAELTGSDKYIVSKTMAFTDSNGYTEFNVRVNDSAEPLRIWVVDELTGYAKAFMWLPGSSIRAPK